MSSPLWKWHVAWLSKIGVKRAAAQALELLPGRGRVVVGLVVQHQPVGGPFPDVADQLLHAAHADAAGKLFDGHGATRARAPQVGPAAVHGLAPRIAALQQRMPGRATGQLPALTHSASVGSRLPTQRA